KAPDEVPIPAGEPSIPPLKAAVPAKTPDKTSDAASSPAVSQRPVPETDVKPVAKVITPAKPPNAGTRSLVRSLGLKLARVVIDAGHGGHDTGSIGPGGFTEKELVLDVADRIRDLIQTVLDAAVVQTRGDGVTVTQVERPD